MVVHDAGHVIGGIAVGFDQDEIVESAGLEHHLAADEVVEFDRAFERYFEPDHGTMPVLRTGAVPAE